MNKKAISRIVLISLLTAILVFGMSALGVRKAWTAYIEESAKKICRASVDQRSSALAEIAKKVPGVKLPPLRCKTTYTCLHMGGECPELPEDYKKVRVEDEEDIKKEIAEAMRWCWWMLAEGKEDFAPEYIGETYCVICYVLAFDENVKEKFSSIKGAAEYLEKPIPGENVTYLQYITNNPNPLELEKDPGTSDELLTIEPIAITFAIGKYTDLKAFLSTMAAGAMLYGGGGALMGSFIPGVGTVAGAGVGGIVGTVTGFIAAFHQIYAPTHATSLFRAPYTTEALALCGSMEYIP